MQFVVFIVTLAYIGCTYVETAKEVCPTISLDHGDAYYNNTVGGSLTMWCNDDNYRLQAGSTYRSTAEAICSEDGQWVFVSDYDDVEPICAPVYGPPLAKAMFLGARVQRGKDWSSGDEDGGGPGTVEDYMDGWVTVRWDHGTVKSGRYELGENNKYSVTFVPGTYYDYFA